MSNPYVPPTLSGYNSSPPSDDGSKTTQNAVTWATIKTKLADPLVAFANGISSAVTSALAQIFLNTVLPESANYTVQSADRGKLVTITNGATVTLLAASAAGSGFAVTIKNISTTQAAVIAPNGTDNIDGLNQNVWLAPSQGLTLVSDGAAWWIAAGANGPASLHAREEQASGTNSADSSLTAGGYVKRTLNTVKFNDIAGATLSASQISLPPGLYRVEASTPANIGTANSSALKCRLRNVTDSTTLLVGGNEIIPNSSVVTTQNRARLRGRFALSATKTIELESFVNNGLGVMNGGTADSSGEVEVYSEIFIEKLG